MKKIILVLAAALTSLTMAFAQDYNEVVDKFNKGAEALENGDLETALACLQETYAEAINLEEAEEIASQCKTLIPTIAYRIAVKEFNEGNMAAAAEKAAAAASIAGEMGDSEKAAEAESLAKDAAYEAAKQLEDTDIEAAKDALKALVATDPERANGRLAFLTSKQATELQKEASAIADPAAKKAAFKKVYDLAKESLAYEETAGALKTMATAARSIDEFDEAITGYERYLEVKPDAKDALKILNNLGICYEKVGNKAKALEYFKQVAAGDDEKLKASALKKIEKLSK